MVVWILCKKEKNFNEDELIHSLFTINKHFSLLALQIHGESCARQRMDGKERQFG
jgi:hypothetical protein